MCFVKVLYIYIISLSRNVLLIDDAVVFGMYLLFVFLFCSIL